MLFDGLTPSPFKDGVNQCSIQPNCNTLRVSQLCAFLFRASCVRADFSYFHQRRYSEVEQRKKKQREKKRGRKREESFPSHHSKMKIATRRFKLKLRSGAPRAEVPLEVIARAVCACLSAG